MIILRPCTLLQTYVGCGPSRFLSLQRRFHLQPASPRAIFAAPDRKDPREPFHTCSVPSIAKLTSVTSKSVMQVASTYLRRDAGNTKSCPCIWFQLPGINILLVLCEYGTTDLCEVGTRFNCPVDGFLY